MSKPLSIRARVASFIAGTKGIEQLNADFLQRVAPGGTKIPPRRDTRGTLMAYNQSPFLRSVVQRKGEGVSKVNWRIYVNRKQGQKAIKNFQAQKAGKDARTKILKAMQDRRELDEIVDHPLLTLLDRPNDLMSGTQMLRLTSNHYDLVGEAFWVIVRNSRLRTPAQLYPIPPHWISQAPIDRNGTYLISFNGLQAEVAYNDMVWFKDLDPENPYYRGSGKGLALGDEIGADEFSAKHIAAWFYNGAVPNMMVYGKGLDKTEIERMEYNWLNKFRGVAKRFQPYFTNRELTVQELNTTFQEMQLVELRRFLRDTFYEAYGAPKEIFGVTENSNRAVIEAADFLWTSKVIDPTVDFIRGGIQMQLAWQFDDRIILDYDTVIQEDITHKLAVYTAASHIADTNEWRALAGDDAMPDEKGGNLRAVKIGTVFTDNLNSEIAQAVTPMDPNAPPAAGTEQSPNPADAGAPKNPAAPENAT